MKKLIGLFLMLVLAGCGGGGGGGGGGDAAPAQSATGIWQGQLFGAYGVDAILHDEQTGGGITNDISCLVAETLELACLLFEVGTRNLTGGATGTVRVANGNQMRGSGTVYATAGFFLADGSTRANFTITGGTISERNALTLTIDGTGALTNISMTYDALYERGSSLAVVSGVYNNFFIEDVLASLSIDAGGATFSQTTSGCIGNGQVSIIDSQFNGYDVSLTVSNCPGLNGMYDGLAVTTDFISTNDTLLFAAFTSTQVIVADPNK